MKKLGAALLLCILLCLSACRVTDSGEEEKLTLVATTYPVYLFTTAVVGETPGVEVISLVKEPTACLHNYTLTVEDMKAIDRADVIIMNGAGLEDFLSDALDSAEAKVIDCSAGISLLPSGEHGEHEEGEDHHHEENDPHIWMDPHLAGTMVENIAAGLSELDGAHAEVYLANRDAARKALEQIDPFYRDAAFPPYPLITFHDGFQYFARAQGFELLAAIEEEEGSTASALEIREMVELIETCRIPAIFVEKNGSRATAGVIARETGCAVVELDMVMSGDGKGIEPYVEAISGNVEAILEAMR